MKMKARNKILLLALCMAALIAVSVIGTMAYLTSTAEVTNTFTVGNVNITMTEAKVDEYGKAVENAERVTANTYKLIPGHEYKKDPTVYITAGSENCYIFVKVENGISDIEASGDTTIAAQLTAKGWKAVGGTTGVYVYAGTEEGATKKDLAAGSNAVVFDSFKIADTADIASKADSTIKITAYAIQADGFADKTPAEIWAATGFSN